MLIKTKPIGTEWEWCTLHKAQVWAADKIGRSNYFETSFTLPCTMVTRSVVTILLVTLFAMSDGKKNFEQTFRNCQENFECVHRSVCEYYNQRLAEYRRTNKTNNEIFRELKSLICNNDKKAVCCKKEQQSPTSIKEQQSPTSCGMPQKIPESVKTNFIKKKI